MVTKLKISVVKNWQAVRKAFIDKFVMTFDEFQASYTEWIDSLASKGHTVAYEDLYLWDLMEYRAISFATALELLRSLSEDVYVTSERESHRSSHEFEIGGVKYREAVFKMNAAVLADLIEHEWYESYRLFALDMHLEHTVLPEDLYVFDGSMEHLLVFTHETDFWELELEEPMRCAESRFCMMYGFELPEAVPYEAIRAMLLSEPCSGSSLKIELSFSCSKFFRRFIISKQVSDVNAGCEYRFDFDRDASYPTWEATETARVFNGMSLAEIAGTSGVRFDVILDGH